jgi:hypothetical protein
MNIKEKLPMRLIFRAMPWVCLLAGCSPSQEAYMAVHQVVSDPIIFHLGGHYYLTKERDGDFFLVILDGNDEVAEIKKLL